MIFFELERGQTDQTIHEVLSGVPVTIRVIWNERFKYWSMNIYNRQQDLIIAGVKLVTNYKLIGRFNLSALAGDFVFVRISGDKTEADVDSIGNDFQLIYLSEVEANVI